MPEVRWRDLCLVTSGSSLGCRCARLECRWLSIKCSHQRRHICRKDIPMHPTIVRLIIALPFNPEFLLSFVDSCIRYAVDLVSCHTSMSLKRRRVFISCPKTLIASFEKLQRIADGKDSRNWRNDVCERARKGTLWFWPDYVLWKSFLELEARWHGD